MQGDEAVPLDVEKAGEGLVVVGEGLVVVAVAASLGLDGGDDWPTTATARRGPSLW
jgi:hypothetical protein